MILSARKISEISASVQVSEGNEIVAVVFKFSTGDEIRGGDVIAEHGCWTLLKGGIVANFTSPVEILFEVMTGSKSLNANRYPN